jgi:hypothetical protein
MSTDAPLSQMASAATITWSPPLPHAAVDGDIEASTGPGRERSLARWGGRLERLVVFAGPFALYLTLAAILVLHYHDIYGDAESRLANAYYTLYSRDPHLSAVGFVWNPLTSFAEVPLLLFKSLWPPLTTQAFAANIMSSLYMATAGYQLFRFFEDLRISRLIRWGLFLCFALNPQIAHYGANGMSEALFIMTLVVTARFLARWLVEPTTRSLLISGLFLGLGYFARNEAAAAAAIATAIVVVATYLRTDGPGHIRRMAALTDGILYCAFFLLSFVGWAGASWVIVGHPFEQFSSIYGNSSQIAFLGLGHPNKGFAIRYASRAILSYAPLLPIAILGASIRGWRERDPRFLAVLAVPGGVVLFEILAYVSGQIAPWYRYFIYSVPLMVMLAGCVAMPPNARRSWLPPRQWLVAMGRRRISVRGVAVAGCFGVLGLVLAVPSVLSTGETLLHSSLAADDQSHLNFIIHPHSKAAKENVTQYTWEDVKKETARIDAMHLPHGALMVDNFTPCIPQMILDSSHPKQFAIPNDEDFKAKLGIPYEFGVRYFLVPSPSGGGTIDALNRQYPYLYDNGQGLANLVTNVNMRGCPPMRLYKLIPQSA